jgi:vacuolar-type H+-ATPase subunit I/STV1
MVQESHQDVSSGNSSDSASGDGAGDGKPKHVSYETYEKTLRAEKNAKQKLQEVQERLMSFENEKKTVEEQKLLSEKKHIEYIEQLKREKQELEQKTSHLLQEQTDFRKLNAALGLLQEKGVQLESKYLGLLPLDRIEITDEGSIDLTSVSQVVTDFQKEHPRLTAPAKAFLPSDKSSSSANSLSVDEWKKLPYKEKTEAMKSGRVKHNFKF